MISLGGDEISGTQFASWNVATQRLEGRIIEVKRRDERQNEHSLFPILLLFLFRLALCACAAPIFIAAQGGRYKWLNT